MLASFASVGLNLTLNLSLMHVLGYRAFPLSASIAAVVNISILFFWLPRKIGKFDLKPLLRYAAALALASVASGGAAALLVPARWFLAGDRF